jgi:hypothetical protein
MFMNADVGVVGDRNHKPQTACDACCCVLSVTSGECCPLPTAALLSCELGGECTDSAVALSSKQPIAGSRVQNAARGSGGAGCFAC